MFPRASEAFENMILSTIKERPILFSGPMVRAILKGRKTQTRRIVKGRGMWAVVDNPDSERTWPGAENECGDWQDFQCPYGEVGDRLWVREAWAPASAALPSASGVVYRADYHTGLEKRDGDQKWKPSIHMFRQDSRINLEITGIRVERLNEISRGDAMGEGCPFQNIQDASDPRAWFKALWSQINGTESWAENPWVWVVEFKRIEQR